VPQAFLSMSGRITSVARSGEDVYCADASRKRWQAVAASTQGFIAHALRGGFVITRQPQERHIPNVLRNPLNSRLLVVMLLMM